MRLGLIGPTPPPNGGMALQTLQLERLLGVEGVQVELLATNAPYQPACVENLRGVRALFRLLPYLWRVWRLTVRVDVIHLMANSGWSWQLFAAPVLWLGRLRGVPVIVNYRGGEAREYLAASHRWIKPSLARAAYLVVPSGFLQQVFEGYEIASKIIPNIIDLEFFRPATCEATREVSAERFKLVITRNLEPIYGLETAIRAVALVREELPYIQLEIAGSGPQREDLQMLIHSLGLQSNVVLLGRLEREEVLALYQGADAMLNPTKVDNMPNSVLESMACGLPVISTNVGGVPFIVRDGESALLVEPNDHRAMANAILRLKKDLPLRECLKSAGLQEVADYSWRQVGPQWISLYRSCMGAAS
ncbi:MAG: glycosyltransferase involved in cell wall biosynthesis [Bacteroidia bacterium]|jgi:glycosyltransferase involved in cell wall biosynthesis